MKMRWPEYFLYYVDEYGQKKFYLGDGKFVTWLASEVGCTKFDRYMKAAEAWEQVHEIEPRVHMDFH